MNILDYMTSGKIKLKSVERVIGPFVANKYTLIYSDNYPLKAGKSFYIIYKKTKEEVIVDKNRNILRPKKKFWLTNYGQYKLAKGVSSTNNREFYFNSHKLIVLKKHRKKGTIKRFFARRNDDISQRIFEIKEQQFGMDSIFYDKVSLSWKLNGSEEDIKLRNTRALEEADKTLPGIKDLLNPLEFYIKEDLTIEEKVKNTLKLLEYHEYQYETREEAKTAALGLGLKRVHLMKNGYWMVGKNHEEYMEAIGKIPKAKRGVLRWKRARRAYQRPRRKKLWGKSFKSSY